MGYKITIEQTSREQIKTREYKQIGVKEDGDPKYGYVDDEKTEDVKREVYSQRVDELDLVAVINAVNKGKEK